MEIWPVVVSVLGTGFITFLLTSIFYNKKNVNVALQQQQDDEDRISKMIHAAIQTHVRIHHQHAVESVVSAEVKRHQDTCPLQYTVHRLSKMVEFLVKERGGNLETF